MRTEELDFDLPQELIAIRPCEPRDAARLMVLSRTDPDFLEHRRVRDLPEILRPGDTLVFNRTRVLPARFEGKNIDTGGGVQGLWLRDGGPDADGALTWIVLLKARRFRPGRRVALLHEGRPAGVELVLLAKEETDEPGAWRVRVEADPRGTTEDLLQRAGMTPLPPYILAARKAAGAAVADAFDRAAYQTVFADPGASGSVAAPTAGLHFTPELLERLAARGVRRDEVTLHVGAGTFKPVEAETLEEHRMHAEWCSLGPDPERFFRDANRGRLITVGSTSTRTIEAYAALRERGGSGGESGGEGGEERGGALPEWLATDLLIAPGYRPKRVDGVMTNFHLPRSTLIALVAGLLPGGIEQVRRVYREAIRERYRFFSYGDAMVIL